MKTVCIIIAVIVLFMMAMWLIKKIIEAAWDLRIIHQASKNKHHPSWSSSSGIVLNKKTKKLEACGDKINLPF